MASQGTRSKQGFSRHEGMCCGGSYIIEQARGLTIEQAKDMAITKFSNCVGFTTKVADPTPSGKYFITFLSTFELQGTQGWTSYRVEQADNDDEISGQAAPQVLQRACEGLRAGSPNEFMEAMEEVRSKSNDPDDHAQWILGVGALKLVSAQWLLNQGESYFLQRCQDLPPEAFLSPQRAAHLYKKEGGIVVLSYGWLSKKHPDPNQWHLKRVSAYLRAHLAEDGPFFFEDVGVFWDFMCLPNGQRSPLEQAIFQVGIGAINLLYGSLWSVVIQAKLMPSAQDLTSEEPATPTASKARFCLRFCGPWRSNQSTTQESEPNLIPYEDRGWTCVEEAISGIAKSSRFLLDLANAEQAQALLSGGNIREIMKAGISNRRPPLHPKVLTELLESKTFTNQSDKGMVSGIYLAFFSDVCARAQRLVFFNHGNGTGWNSEDAATFAKTLPLFESCFDLNLEGQQIGAEGVRAIAEKLPEMKAISKVILRKCYIGDEAVKFLCVVMPKVKNEKREEVFYNLSGNSNFTKQGLVTLHRCIEESPHLHRGVEGGDRRIGFALPSDLESTAEGQAIRTFFKSKPIDVGVFFNP